MPGGMTATQLARRNANEQARLDAALTDLIEHRISFKQVLSLKVQALAPQWVLGIEMRPERVGHFHCGRLHGGVISAVLDAMGGSALMCALGEKHAHEAAETAMQRFARFGTIDLRVDLSRPGL